MCSSDLNFVELDSYDNSAIRQYVNTVGGSEYKISFDYSPRVGQPDTTNGISAYWNETLLGEITATGGDINLWQLFEFTVTGNGEGDYLTFVANGINDSLGGNLDNIRMTETPLPAAGWLFASALGFMGLGRRKSV